MKLQARDIFSIPNLSKYERFVIKDKNKMSKK